MLLAALGGGCRKGAGVAGDTTDAGGTPPSAQAGQVLARVGSHTITLGDYLAALEHMDQFDRLRYQAPERRKELLAEMIDVTLLADEAREQGYDKDPATQQEIREILRDAVLEEVRDGAALPSDLPESEARKYFESHRSDFHDPERRRVSAIVVTSTAAATAILDTLKKNHAAWGELVRSKSVEPHAKADAIPELAGDLGFVSPPGDPRGNNANIPPEVRAAVFAIARVGDVAPTAIEAAGRAYVVKLAGKTDPQDRTFQDAERSIRVKLAQQKVRERDTAFLEDLRKQYPVTIDEAALSQVKVEVDDGGRP
jgi:parvulin-like peptidyl-prolyl isomerase